MDTNDALHADLLVIGFGKGGTSVARKMSELGKRVVMVEQSDRMYGGTCPNVGCVPTKALVHQSGKRLPGASPQEMQQVYERAVGDVQALTALFRKGNFEAMNGADTATVITGRAVFTGPHTVEVDVAGE